MQHNDTKFIGRGMIKVRLIAKPVPASVFLVILAPTVSTNSASQTAFIAFVIMPSKILAHA